ncbi:MAG: AsmA-like C-terminal region-containing protein, partial [Candidatus Binatia bacterium]
MNARLKDSPHEIEGLTTKIEFREDSLSVPPTRFQLGGSPVEVQAKIDSLRSRAGTFRLQSPGLRAASLGVAGEAVAKEEVIRGLDLSGAFRAPGETPPEIDGKLRSEGGTLRDVDYQNLTADFALRENVATLRGLALRAFDGSYDGSGRYDMRDPDMPRFDFRSTIRDMSLKGLLGNKFPGAEEKIEGLLHADLELDGSGKEWERIRQNLRGQGRVDVKDGVLKDVNVAEQVLTGITGVPGLSNLISPRTRAKYPDLFATGDTKFEKLGGSVAIADGVARTDDMTLAARDYAIRGEGTFALENQLDFTATLVASKPLTDDIVDDVKEAKYIANEEGRLAIPFRATGSLPNVKPRPDTDYLARAVARAAV